MSWINKFWGNGSGDSTPALPLRSRKLLRKERIRVAREFYGGPLQELADLVMVLGFQSHDARSSRHPEIQEIGQHLAGLYQTGLAVLKALRECLSPDSLPE